MIAALLLSGIALLPPADFRTRSPELEAYHAEQDAPPAPESEEPKGERSFAWRALGWLNYAAAGCTVASQYYRQDRSAGYDANPDNDAARIALLSGSVLGANQVSDKLYENNREWGWVGRIASIGVLAYSCSSNFYQGWEGR